MIVDLNIHIMPLPYSYNVNSKRFINFFQAHDYAKENNGFVDFKLSESDVNSYLSVDVERLNHIEIRSLYKSKISWIRDNFKKTRLCYSAGTDSHTILQLSQEMGIEYDSVELETCSITRDPKLDVEHLPGIEYATQTGVRNFKVIRPEVRHFERYHDPFWVKDVCGGNLFGFRGAKIDVVVRDSEPMTCISGMDKAWVYVSAEGKYYWVITDYPYTEYMRFDHVPFFLDSNIPEVAVKQAYCVKKFLQERHPHYRGLFESTGKMDIEEKLCYLKYTGRPEPLSPLLADPNIMGKKIPRYLNRKNQGVMQELKNIGRGDLVDAFYHSLEMIKKQYRDHNSCLSVDDEGNPNGILRYAAVFELGDTHIKQVSDDVIDLSVFK